MWQGIKTALSIILGVLFIGVSIFFMMYFSLILVAAAVLFVVAFLIWACFFDPDEASPKDDDN